MQLLSYHIVEPEDMIPAGGKAEIAHDGAGSVRLFSKNDVSCSLELPLLSLPEKCCAIKITLRLLSAPSDTADVFSSEVFQGVKSFCSAPVRSFVEGSNGRFRNVVLESCLRIEPDLPVRITIKRRSEDEADTFQSESALAGVEIGFLSFSETASLVENSPGYNSWPMCQTLNGKIVCTYSRGSAHDIFEAARGVYARVSSDGGSSWEEETTVCNTPGRGDVTTGKGLDENGKMLLWVRHAGDDGYRHRLFRSTDGKSFETLCDPELPANLIQITDIFHLPGTGMMAMCFGGSYGASVNKYWGTLVSRDNGRHWYFTVIEKDLDSLQWPTEPSAVVLDGGRILAIARTESHEDSTRTAQFQLISADCGKTWQKTRTNITDVNISTPSLIYDPGTGLVNCYYFYRGRGVLLRRSASAEYIFRRPFNWPAAEPVATGSCEVCEAGNVNAVRLGSKHVLSYYSGSMPHTAVYVKTVPSHQKEK